MALHGLLGARNSRERRRERMETLLGPAARNIYFALTLRGEVINGGIVVELVADEPLSSART